MKRKLEKIIIYHIIIILMFQAINTVFIDNVSGDSSDEWLYVPDIIVPDDYDTIQAAIDHSNTYSCIGIREGTHHESLIIEGEHHNGLTIIGSNRSNTIITADEALNTDTILICNTSFITIANLTIKDSGKGYDENDIHYNSYGIKSVDSHDVVIDSNRIIDNGNGINCDGGTKITISNNEIMNNLDDGIDGNGQFYIYNNNISHNGYGFPPDKTNGDGIEIMSSSSSSEIINNIISYNAVDGIWDETIDDHLIIDNSIHHNGQSGVHLEEGRDCKIRNNKIFNNGFGEFGKAGAGIILLYSTSNLIDNNEIYDNKRGIYVDQSHFNEISDNYIYKNKRVGIEFDQTSGNQIFNNIVSENFVGMYLKFASNFRINYNDIYLNTLFGMVSLVSIGGATSNWWGNMFGPYVVQMLRLPPLLTIVTPWATHRINDEGDY